MICEAWEIVTVPFPFTDKAVQKKRPALVLSAKAFNRHGHSVMAMITSSSVPWPGDTPIADLTSAGLSSPCVVRLKLFTIDNRLFLRKIGQLSATDRVEVATELKTTLPLES